MSYTTEDTIVAISTPPGHGGLGVLRISGPAAVAIADRLFTSTAHVCLQDVPSHTLHHGWITDGAAAVDEVMAAVMRAPRSYTGEDIVEFSAHGGPVVLSQILDLCRRHGARPAGPGEFTFRAFTNGKMDLARAEAVADLIDSKTALAARSALHQLKGGLSEKIADWRQKLVELIAALEAALDYAEEDIRFLTKEETGKLLGSLIEDTAALRATADKGRLIREGLKVALIGKPNAGKSSLLNALLERERAIVTDIPGTTRDILEEALDCQGLPLVVIDTAGLREHTADPVEKIGHDRTKAAVSAADLVLWLLDASADLSDEDRYIASLLSEENHAARTIIVLNKIDRSCRINSAVAARLLDTGRQAVAVSALRRTGLADLEKAILSFAGAGGSAATEPLMVNARHAACLDVAQTALKEALAANERNYTEEIVAFHAREAAQALSGITGSTTTEEILGTIFAKFCVGK